MTRITIRIGLLPSRRMRHSLWCETLRSDSLAMLARAPGVEVLAPPVAADNALHLETGATPHGTVSTLDEAEAVAALFLREGVDALVICPLDFGDERSAAKVAERLGVPILLYATKEPPAVDDPGMARVSDSYCGNLSIAAALHRRKIPFRFAGIGLPGEPELEAEVADFVAATGVAKVMRGARIGQVGVRPMAFETVAYDEVAMARLDESEHPDSRRLAMSGHLCMTRLCAGCGLVSEARTHAEAVMSAAVSAGVRLHGRHRPLRA